MRGASLFRSLGSESSYDDRLIFHPSRGVGLTAMGAVTCTPFPLDVMAIYALYQVANE